MSAGQRSQRAKRSGLTGRRGEILAILWLGAKGYRLLSRRFGGKGGEIDLIVNTPYGVGPRVDGYEIRTAAVIKGVPCITTVQGLAAAVQGIDSLSTGEPSVRSLQEHGADLAARRAAGQDA